MRATTHRIRRWAPAVTALVAGTLLLGAPAAQAAGEGLANAKARAASDISVRLTTLQQQINLVQHSAPPPSSADATAVLAIMNTDVSGLTALNTKIQGDTTLGGAVADAATIYSAYRVYALVLPQVHLIKASDLVTGQIVPRLQRIDADLQAAIQRAKANGKDVSATTAPMADLAAQITAMTTTLGPVPGQLLAMTPAQCNANHLLVRPVRQDLATARHDLDLAHADAAAVLVALK